MLFLRYTKAAHTKSAILLSTYLLRALAPFLVLAWTTREQRLADRLLILSPSGKIGIPTKKISA
jgi:hypothetical protein